MELREWAEAILTANTIEDKLAHPGQLTDINPGNPLIISEPSRPQGMEFTRKSKEDKLPPFQEHGNSDKRAICLHRFAGHELLAVEIMAYTLLAFPDAPPTFRKGLAHTLAEEQGHVRLYMNRMVQLGISFGDLPLYKHFWMHVPYIKSPLHYISIMSLTFEMANLDFAPIYGKSFSHFGDEDSASLMSKIVEDEISHVRFGWRWLKQWKAETKNEWETWKETLSSTLLTPNRAKGFFIHEETRLKAGLPPEWIENLKNQSRV